MPRVNSTDSPIITATQAIAREVAAPHSASVDGGARFPTETFEALKAQKLLSAAVPRELGGGGASMTELAGQCAALSGSCGSSGMVLAMHHIQVACIARHGMSSPFFRGYMKDIVEKQLVLASMTSEVGTWGDTRSSICAVERDGDRFKLDKDATTGSYCASADGILITSRRAPDAPKSDQVLVLACKGHYALEQTTTWDTMGMRGTVSPGYKISTTGHTDQILPGSFADSSAQTMVPYSHILWAALWYGIAADAVGRAAAFVRAAARKNPGTVPPAAHGLAEAHVALQVMRNNVFAMAAEFDALGDSKEGMDELLNLGWALKFNNLKVASSEAAPAIVHQALKVIGIMGFKNDSKFSVGRHLRDTLSAALMISNERIVAKSASMLLVFKDD
jgi:acyl-CoA dehydrogenase